ncbi:hypothetical protein [Chryseobacterium sp. 52]|uniref:hypothetical protein n=1 Tax=Chryseobacterium sp. 52 TaxID=2035213 RepID=UPI00117FF4CA|nr:hypothetical protein [Chryseobacterium sp. 52]
MSRKELSSITGGYGYVLIDCRTPNGGSTKCSVPEDIKICPQVWQVCSAGNCLRGGGCGMPGPEVDW